MPDRPLRYPDNPGPIQSPCVRNCCLDDNDICMGCFRSLEEIIRWGGAGDRERLQILQRASRRRQLEDH